MREESLYLFLAGDGHQCERAAEEEERREASDLQAEVGEAEASEQLILPPSFHLYP
jgi:hypothetical protein